MTQVIDTEDMTRERGRPSSATTCQQALDAVETPSSPWRRYGRRNSPATKQEGQLEQC